MRVRVPWTQRVMRTPHYADGVCLQSIVRFQAVAEGRDPTMTQGHTGTGTAWPAAMTPVPPTTSDRMTGGAG